MFNKIKPILFLTENKVSKRLKDSVDKAGIILAILPLNNQEFLITPKGELQLIK